MAEKGLVHRDESERSHTYIPAHAEEVVQSSLLNDLMDRAFSSSAFNLVQRALDGANASAEELDGHFKFDRQGQGQTQARQLMESLVSTPRLDLPLHWRRRCYIHCGSARFWRSRRRRR